VLVDFWATWCGPCIAEIPNMLEAHAKYGKRGFEIIGVSLDRTDEAIVKFNEQRKIPWNSINIEDSKKLAEEYGVNAIPFPVLIDREGNVVSLRARGPQLDRLLERLFSDEKK
jgi:thiol-disulfide isomerase/thioredoxin